ncbi:unnamed protein product [Acanthoscelides obtectus]|uniref:Uncharacterized protein n=1 Tax=Acanthoscelides obtectus TaxID=200917 RepID=A0A9P0JM57_ACAOB|nr:unnamed protein product [Acanthoscelides obtectus]CAK1641384.1 hypothetical protein AOBTE_LOCUS12375 [Acanthoscelides obtectus]
MFANARCTCRSNHAGLAWLYFLCACGEVRRF